MPTCAQCLKLFHASFNMKHENVYVQHENVYVNTSHANVCKLYMLI